MDEKDRARLGYSQRKLTDPLALARIRQHEAEQRTLDAVAMATGAGNALQSRAHVTEPRVYGPASPNSWFVDLYKDERGSDGGARQRLEAHGREAAADATRRAEQRTRAFTAAYELQFGSTPGEQRALAAWTGAGRVLYERRSVTRVDGAGGYFVPPAWLIDEFTPAPRADVALANAVTQMPLPEYCDSVNIPGIKTGIGSGVQAADVGLAPGSDLSDQFVTAAVRTLSGTQDVAAIWLDQGSGGAGGHLDQMIWQDLHQAEQLQLSGQLILGSGTNGQMLGLLPPVTAIGTPLAVYAPNSNTNATQTLSYNGSSGTTLLTTIGQCVSGITRARGRRPSHILTAPWLWDLVSTMSDQQSRPLVNGHGPHPIPDGAEPEPGVVGYLPGIGLPVLGDLNLADTFGGGVSPPAQPYLSTVNDTTVAWKAGTGASALYTPILPVVAKDIVVFLGEPKMRLMREVLGGNLKYRFQIYRYAAAMVNRYTASGSGTLANSGGWAAGACTSYGVVTQFGSNSLTSRTGQGF
jgi:HK97 family phage major capsid protein